MTRKYKSRLLLVFALFVGAFIWMTNGPQPHYTPSGHYNHSGFHIVEMEMDAKGRIEADGLDFVAVQDTLNYWWDQMAPANGWGDMQIAFQYIEDALVSPTDHNFQLWAKGGFRYTSNSDNWFAGLSNLPGYAFRLEAEVNNYTLGFLDADLPVPGMPGRFLALRNIEIGLKHS